MKTSPGDDPTMSVESVPPRILVVDDDPVMRLTCRRILLEAAPPGAAIDEAASAEEAVALVRERPYAIVLSDYHMSWMNGIDLLEIMMREQPGCLRVLMTGRAELELVKEALDRARVDAFIRKPPSAAEMRQKLFSLLAPQT